MCSSLATSTTNGKPLLLGSSPGALTSAIKYVPCSSRSKPCVCNLSWGNADSRVSCNRIFWGNVDYKMSNKSGFKNAVDHDADLYGFCHPWPHSIFEELSDLFLVRFRMNMLKITLFNFDIKWRRGMRRCHGPDTISPVFNVKRLIRHQRSRFGRLRRPNRNRRDRNAEHKEK